MRLRLLTLSGLAVFVVLLAAYIFLAVSSEGINSQPQDDVLEPSVPIAYTYLEEYMLEGRRMFAIYIYGEADRVPAETYIAGTTELYPEIEIDVEVIVSCESVKTGDIIDGRTVIRYAYIASCAPGTPLPDLPFEPLPDPTPLPLPPMEVFAA